MLTETHQDTNVNTQPWHYRSADDIVAFYKTDVNSGLNTTEAQTRLSQYGYNELTEGKTKTPLAILWEQLTQPLVLLLIFAAVVSAFLGKSDSVIAISAIVVLNAALGVFQEYRAEKAMAALKKMSAPLVRVRRNNLVQEIESREIVPGDLVLLEAGNIIPADARVVSAINLRVEEASLTGESYPVDKMVDPIPTEQLPLGDRKNMLYMGTSVTYGRGTAVVVSTGMDTELGRIARLIQGVSSEPTPLQRRMAELGKVMFGAAVVIMAIAFIIGLLRGEAIVDILVTAVAIAVAVVPEGLPAVVTISLALGTQRMLRRNALIRKLPTVETLGSVTVICSDKTGTLTENRMTLKLAQLGDDEVDFSDLMTKAADNKNHIQDSAQALLLLAGALSNDAILQGDDAHQLHVIGDPTEGALAVAAARVGFWKHALETIYPRVGEVPFSSERKQMTTIHRIEDDSAPFLRAIGAHQGDYLAFSKGAYDHLLPGCAFIFRHGQIEPLTDALRQQISTHNERLASQGLRVLGVAFRLMDAPPSEDPSWASSEQNMVFLGLVGIIDPPRPEVKDAVATCRKAGIRAVMITGDHPITARAIATELGIINTGDRVATGVELEAMTDSDLQNVVERVSVYARVSPEHKLRIVKALQSRGHIVAMTGDGVNDAPALKQASIGVAMSITGTDVSKEASDMVLLDDNFATIVRAAKEGRTIYDNVRRFVKYLLASNTGELFVLFATQLIQGMSLPLTTLQILWMNLITDGIPALALGVERAEKDAMSRPPYAPNESIFGRGLGRHILIVGGLLGITSLLLGYIAWSNDWRAANGGPAWNTMVFIMLTLAQMGHALGVRSHRDSLFTLGITTNPYLLGAVVLTVFLQMMAIYTPFFNQLFNTNPLTLNQLVLCLVLSTVVFWGVEVEKWLIRRGVFK